MTNDETIFAEALRHPTAAERRSYLDRACAGDAGLRAHVEVLLAAHVQSAGILDAGAAIDFDLTANPSHAPAPEPTERAGAVIGPYKLLEQIGGGGMGMVYMAEQVRPVRRKVALKIIKPGMDSGQVIARFEAERQALTMMDHPNIAKVLDAGTTDAGRPYFVMELVKGIPDHRLLRPGTAGHAEAAGTVRPGLPRRAARAPEGHHPPRPQTDQRAGYAAR